MPSLSIMGDAHITNDLRVDAFGTLRARRDAPVCLRYRSGWPHEKILRGYYQKLFLFGITR